MQPLMAAALLGEIQDAALTRACAEARIIFFHELSNQVDHQLHQVVEKSFRSIFNQNFEIFILNQDFNQRDQNCNYWIAAQEASPSRLKLQRLLNFVESLTLRH